MIPAVDSDSSLVLDVSIPEHLKGFEVLSEFYKTYIYPNRNEKVVGEAVIPSLLSKFNSINQKSSLSYSTSNREHEVLLRLFHAFLAQKPTDKIDFEYEIIWSVPLFHSFALKWHVEVFEQLIPMKFIGTFRGEIEESDLLDYFMFIVASARQVTKTQLLGSLERCVKLFMDHGLVLMMRFVLEYFSEIFSLSDGLLLLKHHSQAGWNRINSKESVLNWQQITFELIRRFPELVYEKDFNGLKKKGEERYSNAVFLHFGPIISLLQAQNTEMMTALSGSRLDCFALYRSGNVRNAISMGSGGLSAIDTIIMISKINFFYDAEDFKFKKFLFAKLFNLFFPSLETLSIAVFNFLKFEASSLLESVLIYNVGVDDTNTTSTTDCINRILEMTIESSEKNDITPLLAVISYLNLSEIKWSDLIEKFKIKTPIQNQESEQVTIINPTPNQDQQQELKSKTETPINFAETAYHLYNCTQTIASCRHNVTTVQIIQDIFEALMEDLTIYCDTIYREPLQLDVMRIILARKFGIPLNNTRYSDFTNETFEWSEAIGFLNFHLERAQKIKL